MTTSLIRFNLGAVTNDDADHTRLHRTMLDLCEAADAGGVEEISINEHHLTPNRSMTSPMVLAPAILARTRSARVSLAALLLPLYDPVRLAEDLATIDTAFPGRLRVIAALGYRREEYDLYGVDFHRRGAIMDDALDALLATWTDDCDGVRPAPPRSPASSFLAVGGQSTRAARRAVRYRLPFAPRAHMPDLVQEYESACHSAGVEPACWLPAARFHQVHVSEDPDATWARVGEHYVEDARAYADLQATGPQSPVFSAASTAEELRRSGAVEVVTPGECVALAREPDATVCLHPLAGGMPDVEAWDSLRLFTEDVLPHLHDRERGTGT